ncbi:MAG: hypothetical protein J0L64_01940 [Acidobacteria bacterium]|nr:hypothetical protein [Acidobacteriota bacterium]
MAAQKDTLHGFPTELLQQLGLVIALFSALEDELNHFTCQLIGKPDDLGSLTLIMSNAIGFNERVSLVVEAFRMRIQDPKNVKTLTDEERTDLALRLEKLMDRADRANSKRNELVHSRWSPHPLARRRSEVVLTRKRNRRDHPGQLFVGTPTAKEIAQVADQIERVRAELKRFRDELGARRTL